MEAKLQMVKVSETKRSESNYRSDGMEGPQFEELVQSIREKGVLVPILVRPLKGKGKIGKWEVVAGNRRLAAAKEAGLDEIPARVQDMNDAEAKEAQIVENMQRADVHPLDEGEAFRYLVEDLNHDAESIAKRVGKSVTYVRERLALTNLTEKAATAYRKGDILLGHALLIAKLDEDKQQNDAVKEVTSYGMDTSRLRRWIQERVYTDLGNRPWAKDAKLSEILGDDMGKTSLFGKNPVEDPVEYGRKMAAYIEIMIRKAEEKGEKMVKISTSWGEPDMKAVLGRDGYRILNSKAEVEKCKNPLKGIVAEGNNLGQIFNITRDKEELSQSSTYKLSPEEKAKRKAERLAGEKKRAKENEAVLKAVGKVKWPMSEKHLEVLFDIVFRRFGYSYMGPVASRHGVKAVKTTKNGYTSRDLETPLAAMAKKGGNKGKIQLIFELALESTGNDEKLLKKL